MAKTSLKDSNPKTNFSKITIRLSSPEDILERSHGEVTKPETINYRTLKPERDGLFCERIFGPTKDWQCYCGKYSKIRYKNTVCDVCGVEVTEKKVRRERSGHITLNVPVSHIWYFRSQGNIIGTLLGIQYKKLLSIVYYERYVVIQAGAAAEKKVANLDLLTEEEYYNVKDSLPKDNEYLDDKDPNKFIAKMGSEAIQELLSKLDLDTLSYSLRDSINKETSQQRKKDQLKRLKMVESFREAQAKLPNKPEWMILKVLPVIPPDLRPLVALDGSRFAASDINELYRQVIQRNNRLKKMMDQKAPDVILRNDKRMLQEAVDALLDNTKKINASRGDSNRPTKSLSDNLDGKQGRFRQNLLGKRVDFSGRSVIVVGPELKINECGLPKDMAAELYKPFIIRKLMERGIVKNVKVAKKMVDRKDAVVWDVLESIMKGHPVLLNRAPTLHRLGIQAFQPKMIEGKAIRLHPLVCTAFNADFDGDQMAVHLPLSNAAILEAQLLMLASHNILNPANGAPVTVPTQDMVLGLYYLTKGKQSTPDMKVKGEGQTFYGPEEVIIAYNEQRVDLHAIINCRIKQPNGNYEIIKTTVGRVIFNQVVPEGYGYINSLLTKKTMRSIIMEILNKMGNAVTADFLDDVKNLGYRTAFKGGLSFKLSDVIVPDDKPQTIQAAKNKVDAIQSNYNMGIITDNERYNQIIDGWKDVARGLSEQVVDSLSKDQDGFNPVYMMLDSGARGSKDQIRQLCGIRGLMNKPQKSGDKSGRVTIENPIVASLKEGLSVLEYFISTHGARKGLADTALKTADAGYLTRRLVDVAHDVIISEEDCGTLRGLEISIPRNLEGGKRMDFIVKKLLGRVAVNDIVNPETQDVIAYADEELTEAKCIALHKALIFEVEIRSVLTCESKRGVCARCYGRNLSTGKIVQKGEAVGVIAAQSIGEPGTQLTLRTFHEGGVAGAGKDEAGRMIAKHDGVIEITELRYVDYIDRNKNKVKVVIGRSAELRILDPKTNIALFSANLPYGATLYYNDGDKVKQGELIAEWDAYNAVMISEVSGKVSFHNIIENVTYRVEKDEATGIEEKTIIESKLKSKSPAILLTDVDGNIEKTYDIPVGSILVVEDKKKLKAGDVLVKIPRSTTKASDITGGLPRVQELFEARNASDKAIVAEIDGFVRFGAPKKVGDRIEILPSTKLKNGRKEITIESRSGEYKTYLIPATKQILAQENDFVKAGTPLSEGPITPADILAIQGPTKVQEYIVSQIQGVYQAQDVTINDKHFEVIVRQMMRKVEVMEAGDTTFLEGEIVSKIAFKEENDKINGKKVVIDAGASETYRAGQIISARELRDENMLLKANNKKEMAVRDTVHAVARQILQSITQSALQSEGFLSAASFQQTTKVLTEAAINGKTDYLLGMKANVIIGQHLIPAGTGLPEYASIRVANKEEYARREENLAI